VENPVFCLNVEVNFSDKVLNRGEASIRRRNMQKGDGLAPLPAKGKMWNRGNVVAREDSKAFEITGRDACDYFFNRPWAVNEKVERIVLSDDQGRIEN
jgi:hypothetical protein